MVVKNLKLIAKTEEDLKVVSAHLQDSIVSTSNIANLKKNNLFIISIGANEYRNKFQDHSKKISGNEIQDLP